MISETQAWELNVLRNLQRTYEDRGMRFYINPPREVVPAFLGGYRPDGLAIGEDGGGIVFEVKSYQNAPDQRQIEALRRRVAAQEGWRFEVIYTNPAMDEAGTIAKPTAEQVQKHLEEAERLERAGYHGPAFLAAWAVLESLARLAAPSGLTADGAVGTIQVVQRLAELGYLEHADAGALRALARVRNALVHGDFSVNASAAQVAGFLDKLKALKAEIVKSTSASAE